MAVGSAVLSSESSRLIDNLRFAALFMVVLRHVDPLGSAMSASAQASCAPVFGAVTGWLNTMILPVSICLFYFLSGYLFFRDGVPDAQGYRRKFRSRIAGLVVPYLLWNCLGMLLFLAKNSPWLAGFFPRYEGIRMDALTLLGGFFAIPGVSDTPFDFVLWFLRDLIVTTALAPLLGWGMRHMRWMSLPLLFLFAVYFNGLTSGIAFCVYFFAFGGMMAVSGIDLAATASRLKYLAPVWLAMTTGFEFFRYNTFMMLFLGTAGVFAFLSFGEWLGGTGRCVSPRLAGSAFFVYAFHGLFVTWTVRCAVALVPVHGEISAWSAYLLAFAVTVAVAMGAWYVMRRFFPGFTVLLTGAR